MAVYLALPAEPEFTPVLEAIPEDASVLDLGCGVGRLANLLAARGHDVTGVDESAAMLAHLDPAVTAVEAKVENVDLGRRFDAVVLASHFVNVADGECRRSLLRAATRHVERSGRVYVEHYDPDRMLDGEDSDGQVGDVRIAFRLVDRRGDEFDGRVTFGLGDESWVQEFTARVLDDDALDVALAAAGLARSRRLSPTWISARPDSAAGPRGGPRTTSNMRITSTCGRRDSWGQFIAGP